MNIVNPDGKINNEAVAIEKIKNDLPSIAERSMMLSILLKIKYDCLIQAGFNEAQAIELCRYI